jgi:hypothetical protein
MVPAHDPTSQQPPVSLGGGAAAVREQAARLETAPAIFRPD